MAEAKPLSFELNPEMMELLHKEFKVEDVVSRFQEAIKGKSPDDIQRTAQEIFSEYGRRWIRRTLQLGEEYPDRTYEVLLEAIDHTGGYFRFGLLPQRFLEIAYLSIQEFSSLPIVTCNANQLTYRIRECTMYNEIKGRCGGEVAGLMPCKHCCITALRVLHQDLELDARIRMDSSMAEEGHCQFTAVRS
jgi:hypothetical protein